MRNFTFKISKEDWDCIIPFDSIAKDARFVFINKSEKGRPWIVMKKPIGGFDMIEIDALDGLATNGVSKFDENNPIWETYIKDSSVDVYDFIKDWLYSIDRHDIVVDIFSNEPHKKNKRATSRPAITPHSEC